MVVDVVCRQRDVKDTDNNKEKQVLYLSFTSRYCRLQALQAHPLLPGSPEKVPRDVT